MIDFYLSNYEAEAQLVRHGWSGSSVMSKHLKPVIGVRVKIYSSEKTLADCSKLRNKVGMGTAFEAL
jgi:hypothetical protein